MSKRPSRSDQGFQFLRDSEFEDAAALMLDEYGRQCGQVTAPPVPIDDIIEEHLKLAIEIRNLRAEYPEGDVLGAIYFSDKTIVIDQSLVPEDFPAMLGRYRFTLAHELGHWRLHRHLYLRRAGERSLLPDGPARPNHVLRARQFDPKEVQANRFASCLLMPREMVKREWHFWRGNMDPIHLDELQSRRQQIVATEMIRRGGLSMGEEAINNMLLEHAARPLAEKFSVSPEAMRIRLEGLRLLVRVRETMLFE